MSKTAKEAYARIMESEPHGKASEGVLLRQMILGGQDGLVNVLGIVLGLAGAVAVNPGISSSAILVGGLAATFAESVSMAAVAYTSGKAQRDFYYKELEREKREMQEVPEIEREEIKIIYMKKGFRGKQLEGIVEKICSDDEMWLETMMSEELGLSESRDINPLREGAVVGFASFIGSLVPLSPFFFMAAEAAVVPSLATTALVLFGAGAYKGKTTVGEWWKAGLEMMLVGMGAAFIGYAIGSWAGGVF